LFQNKAGVPARDKHSMAGERATKRKANISKIAYGTLNSFGTSAPLCPKTDVHWSGDLSLTQFNIR
jgi:hypothetical protein